VVPGLWLARGPFLDETKVPPVVVIATCELARELIKQDRTDDKTLQPTAAPVGQKGCKESEARPTHE